MIKIEVAQCPALAVFTKRSLSALGRGGGSANSPTGCSIRRHSRVVLGLDEGLNIELAFAASTGLAMTFALMVNGDRAAINFPLYGGLFSGQREVNRLLINCCVVRNSDAWLVDPADDAITLFVVWRARSITSSWLLALTQEKKKGRRCRFAA